MSTFGVIVSVVHAEKIGAVVFVGLTPYWKPPSTCTVSGRFASADLSMCAVTSIFNAGCDGSKLPNGSLTVTSWVPFGYGAAGGGYGVVVHPCVLAWNGCVIEPLLQGKSVAGGTTG